jgi:hypothetical protein
VGAPDVRPFKDKVGWIYVTDGVQPNPYDHLPPYLAEMVAQLSAPMKGEYIVVTRAGRAPIPWLAQTVQIRSLGTVIDSLRGTDSFSWQQNVSGKAMGWQNCLQAYPDRLTWRINLFDKDLKLTEYYQTTIEYLNVSALRAGFVLVKFSIGTYDGFFKMGMQLIDQNGVEIANLRRQVPAADIISSYVAPCGEGDGSSVTFGSLSASVETQADQSVTDLEALAVPFQTGGESVPFLNTNEGSNTFQTATVNTGTQTTAEVGVGPWA